MVSFICPTCGKNRPIGKPPTGDLDGCRCPSFALGNGWLTGFSIHFVSYYYAHHPLDGIDRCRMTQPELTTFWAVAVKAAAGSLWGVSYHTEVAGFNTNTRQRFDGLLKSRDGSLLAPLEWEYKCIDRKEEIPYSLNEFRKLRETCSSYKPEFAAYIGYAEQEEKTLRLVQAAWEGALQSLLLIVTFFEKKSVPNYGRKQRRVFKNLTMYQILTGRPPCKFFDQPALRWEVPGSVERAKYLEHRGQAEPMSDRVMPP